MNFLRLIRWPNLLIIAATMFLVRYSIVWPGLSPFGPEAITPMPLFILLVGAFMLIAAAGYIINDLSDTDVDSINKPDKMMIGKMISFRNANSLYLILNGFVVLIAAFLGYKLQSWRLTLILLMMIGLLYFYSRRYKRMNLIGNIVVAVASSMSLIIVWLTDFFYLSRREGLFEEASVSFPTITALLMAYTLFSFLTSMIREMVKDVEDVQGDTRYGCQTFPVVAGVRAARIFLLLMSVILLVLMFLWQYNLYLKTFYTAAIVLFVSDFLAVYLIILLARAREKQQFHYISGVVKLLMVSGLISLLFLR